MIHKDRLILMSKLAVLDKKYMKKDLRITKYYLEDYVYFNNLKTRMSLLILIVVYSIAHIFLRAQQHIEIPTTSTELFKLYIIPYGSVILVVLFLYTLLSTKVYKKKYHEAQKRVAMYKELMEALDKHDKLDQERRKSNGRRKAFKTESKMDTNL